MEDTHLESKIIAYDGRSPVLSSPILHSSACKAIEPRLLSCGAKLVLDPVSQVQASLKKRLTCGDFMRLLLATIRRTPVG